MKDLMAVFICFLQILKSFYLLPCGGRVLVQSSQRGGSGPTLLPVVHQVRLLSVPGARF